MFGLDNDVYRCWVRSWQWSPGCSPGKWSVPLRSLQRDHALCSGERRRELKPRGSKRLKRQQSSQAALDGLHTKNGRCKRSLKASDKRVLSDANEASGSSPHDAKRA